MDDAWDPDVYHRFAAERRQPFEDLLALVEPVPGGTAVDLGCGSGELTAALHRHVRAARTTGIDRSPAMLEAARTHEHETLTFEEGDLASWEAPRHSVDVVFANASLQWASDHPAVLGRWIHALAPGGQIAVQMPANFDHPTHLVADELGRDVGIGALEQFEGVLPPEGYALVLDEAGLVDVHVRLQVYVHHLPSTASLIDWVRGTLLTVYAAALDPPDFEAFLSRYRHELLTRLGDPEGTAPYVLTFKRILLRGRRPDRHTDHHTEDATW